MIQFSGVHQLNYFLLKVTIFRIYLFRLYSRVVRDNLKEISRMLTIKFYYLLYLFLMLLINSSVNC